MSQGNSSSFGKEVISASQRLSGPIGQNLTNDTSRTLAPSMGAIAYGSDDNLLYYGSVDAWNVAGLTGSTGQQGLVGSTGATGQAGTASGTGSTGSFPSQFSETHAYMNYQAAGDIVILSGDTIVYNNAVLPSNGQITYNSGTGEVDIVSAGTYLLMWGHNIDGASASSTTTLYSNNVSQGPPYTLRSFYNNANNWDTHPNISCVFTTVSANTLLKIVNSSTLQLNLTDGGISPPQPFTQIAYFTIVRLS